MAQLYRKAKENKMENQWFILNLASDDDGGRLKNEISANLLIQVT